MAFTMQCNSEKFQLGHIEFLTENHEGIHIEFLTENHEGINATSECTDSLLMFSKLV